MERVVRRYLRKGNRRPVGLVMGSVSSDGTIVLGWSLCDKHDAFSKEKARFIADGRMKTGYNYFDPRDYSISGNIPHSLHDIAFWVSERCLKRSLNDK